jgi:hypothetical protein
MDDKQMMRKLLQEVSDTWGHACCEPFYDYGHTLTRESKDLLNRIDELLAKTGPQEGA